MLNDLTPSDALALGLRLFAVTGQLPFGRAACLLTDGLGGLVTRHGGPMNGPLDLRDAGTFGLLWEEFERRTGGAADFARWSEGWALNGRYDHPMVRPTRAECLVRAFEALA